ncbi:MAG: sigma-54-dependent Fis family transcriptional regulator [Archangium gephyra]|uniref:Sigma-54-dependent Fis family transcriptional regulator n=1 Tax=Archangium gephyra TaxID=48 RepID=A0A2W5VS84_9BACT|nr:MAG: sigma-54-dependent Fis family transcriptional regulator [Archangium gephyra]
MPAPLVLIVDDDAGVRFTLKNLLEDEGLRITEATNGQDALTRLEGVDLIISDVRMPELDGLGLLDRVRQQPEPRPPVILVTAHGNERLAVEAMKRGAWDYFKKPFELDEVVAVVRRALGNARLNKENSRLHGEVAMLRSLVFVSPAMSRLAELVTRVAPRDVTVLITGESGTGKERVAESIVLASRRAEAPFVRFNCASLTEELAEAELFGHAKGAFTGAIRARRGLFREADGGTLLLDEVGELGASVQAKLLRVLQEGEVRPVGEDKPVKVDVRLLAATHRDLANDVKAGRFREDLYYRLKVVHLHVPSLRERPEDLPVLARHFLQRAAKSFGVANLQLTNDFIERLTTWSWPGNVRELENVIESAVALSVDGALDLSSVPTQVPSEPTAGLKEKLEAMERGLIVSAMDGARGNVSEAARQLRIGRATLHDKLKKYGLSEGEAERD